MLNFIHILCRGIVFSGIHVSQSNVNEARSFGKAVKRHIESDGCGDSGIPHSMYHRIPPSLPRYISIRVLSTQSLSQIRWRRSNNIYVAGLMNRMRREGT